MKMLVAAIACVAGFAGMGQAEIPAALAKLVTPDDPVQMSMPQAEEDTRHAQMAFGQVCRINPGLACFLQFPMPINSGCQCFFPEFNPPIYYGIVTFQ